MEYCIMYRVENLKGEMIDDYETLEQAKNCGQKHFQIREIYVFADDTKEDIDGNIIYEQK